MRKTEFNEQIAHDICLLLANGMSLRAVCRHEDMPALSTVYKWLRQQPKFAEQYAQATSDRADAVFEEMFEIADDGQNDWMEQFDADGVSIGWKLNGEHVQRSKLRIDARKWALARMNPRKYGERIMNELSGPNGGPIETATTPARDVVAAKLAKMVPAPKPDE